MLSSEGRCKEKVTVSGLALSKGLAVVHPGTGGGHRAAGQGGTSVLSFKPWLCPGTFWRGTMAFIRLKGVLSQNAKALIWSTVHNLSTYQKGPENLSER